MQAEKKRYPVRQCEVCRVGKMIYSRYRKVYVCTNERCRHHATVVEIEAQARYLGSNFLKGNET